MLTMICALNMYLYILLHHLVYGLFCFHLSTTTIVLQTSQIEYFYIKINKYGIQKTVSNVR